MKIQRADSEKKIKGDNLSRTSFSKSICWQNPNKVMMNSTMDWLWSQLICERLLTVTQHQFGLCVTRLTIAELISLRSMAPTCLRHPKRDFQQSFLIDLNRFMLYDSDERFQSFKLSVLNKHCLCCCQRQLNSKRLE